MKVKKEDLLERARGLLMPAPMNHPPEFVRGMLIVLALLWGDKRKVIWERMREIGVEMGIEREAWERDTPPSMMIPEHLLRGVISALDPDQESASYRVSIMEQVAALIEQHLPEESQRTTRIEVTRAQLLVLAAYAQITDEVLAQEFLPRSFALCMDEGVLNILPADPDNLLKVLQVQLDGRNNAGVKVEEGEPSTPKTLAEMMKDIFS